MQYISVFSMCVARLSLSSVLLSEFFTVKQRPETKSSTHQGEHLYSSPSSAVCFAVRFNAVFLKVLSKAMRPCYLQQALVVELGFESKMFQVKEKITQVFQQDSKSVAVQASELSLHALDLFALIFTYGPATFAWQFHILSSNDIYYLLQL